MTYDPQSLYAAPKPGRSIRPAVILGGLVAVVGVVGYVAVSSFPEESSDHADYGANIKSQNSNTPLPPMNFPSHYTPAVYTPPPEPEPPPEEAPASTPPLPRVVASGPPKKKGIPDEERISSLVLQTGASQAASQPNPSPSMAGVQQVADKRGGRDGFYSSAGGSSNAFRSTGIVGQLGPCSIQPGSYIFHESAGVISSDTPGQITARTTRPIYAGPRGDCYASPPGATLVGTYNANTAYGEERIQVAWVGLFLPNGRMVDLGGMPGAGGDGAAGLPADVNNHIGSLAGAVLAGTAVDVIRGLAGSFGSGGDGSDVVVNMGGALTERGASVAERLVDRELNRKPTLTAKREELTVQVTRPIDLEPYRD